MDLFDREATFGDDYLYFYEASLDEARTQADVERILEALDLTPGLQHSRRTVRAREHLQSPRGAGLRRHRRRRHTGVHRPGS